MNCKYFDKSIKKGSCIFSYNCVDECLFKYKKEIETIPQLRYEIEDYKYQIDNLECENIDLQDLITEQQYIITQFESLLEFTKDLLQHTTKTKDELTTDITTMTIPWEYESQLKSVIEGVCHA